MVLQRLRYPMPEDVQLALEARALMDEYLARPEYQQDDYVEWISQAQGEEVRRARINHMLDELADGTAYMKLPYSAKV